jgi:hypothetical protein
MIHHLSPIRMSLSFGQTAARVAAPSVEPNANPTPMLRDCAAGGATGRRLDGCPGRRNRHLAAWLAIRI